MSDDMVKYPRLTDLERKARRRSAFHFRISRCRHRPRFCQDANEAAYRELNLTPQFLRGRIQPDTNTTLLGRTYGVPFGVAPVGLSSSIWPGAEQILARAAKATGFHMH